VDDHCISDALRTRVSNSQLVNAPGSPVRLTSTTCSLSQRAKDAITLEYTCAALRLGVPQDMLSKDYESFLVSFNKRLDQMDSGYKLKRNVVENIERSALELKKSWITAAILRASLMIGHSLLPDHLKAKYPLKILSTRSGRVIQRVLCALLWVLYPSLMWLPLRGMICLLLVLEPQLRPVLLVCESGHIIL
jgi:hypothetical protein